MANNQINPQMPGARYPDGHSGQYANDPAVQEAERIVSEAYQQAHNAPEADAWALETAPETSAPYLEAPQSNSPELFIETAAREAAARHEVEQHHDARASAETVASPESFEISDAWLSADIIEMRANAANPETVYVRPELTRQNPYELAA